MVLSDRGHTHECMQTPPPSQASLIQYIQTHNNNIHNNNTHVSLPPSTHQQRQQQRRPVAQHGQVIKHPILGVGLVHGLVQLARVGVGGASLLIDGHEDVAVVVFVVFCGFVVFFGGCLGEGGWMGVGG